MPQCYLELKDLLQEKVFIAISPVEDKNYIKPKIANQLVIPESNIIGKFHCYNNKKYEIINLQLDIGDYTFISQFSFKTYGAIKVTLF